MGKLEGLWDLASSYRDCVVGVFFFLLHTWCVVSGAWVENIQKAFVLDKNECCCSQVEQVRENVVVSLSTGHFMGFLFCIVPSFS